MKKGIYVGDVYLTPREFDVLELVAEGLTDKKTAGRLCLAKKTVSNTLSRIYSKIPGVSTRTQATVWFRDKLNRLGAEPNASSSIARQYWQRVRRIVQRCLAFRDYTIRSLAEKASIQPDVLSEFLQGEKVLELDSAMNLYDALQQDMTPLDRRTLLKATLLSLFMGVSSGSLFMLHLGGIDAPSEAVVLSPEVILTVFTAQLEKTRRVWRRGDPRQSIEWAGFAAGQLRHLTRKCASSNLRRALQEVLARVLNQKALQYHEILLPDKVLAYTLPIVREIQGIARELEDPRIFGLGEICLGGSYYIRGEYDKAIPLFESGVETVGHVERELPALRGLAVSWAHIGEEKQVEDIETRIKGIIEECRLSRLAGACSALEGVGRGLGILGLSRAFYTLEQSRDIYAEIMGTDEEEPLRPVQLSLSQLDVAKRLEPQDSRLLETVGKEGLHLAKKHGYERHAGQIQSLLGELLN